MDWIGMGWDGLSREFRDALCSSRSVPGMYDDDTSGNTSEMERLFSLKDVSH